jgi:hypothetical protein
MLVGADYCRNQEGRAKSRPTMKCSPIIRGKFHFSSDKILSSIYS